MFIKWRFLVRIIGISKRGASIDNYAYFQNYKEGDFQFCSKGGLGFSILQDKDVKGRDVLILVDGAINVIGCYRNPYDIFFEEQGWIEVSFFETDLPEKKIISFVF